MENDMTTAAPPVMDSRTDPRFVVLHTGLGRWRRGDVIGLKDIGGDQAARRALGLAAIRRAYDYEATQVRVDLPSDTRDASTQQKLAEKDVQIMALTEQVSNLMEQLRSAHPDISRINEASTIQSQAVIREKDQTIANLTNRVKELETQANNINDLVKENTSLKTKLAMHEGQGRQTAEEIQAKINSSAGTETGKRPKPPA
jgi:septal ring factor EnvC (AmiA/AmiB activator)